jgi:hypothetical protein
MCSSGPFTAIAFSSATNASTSSTRSAIVTVSSTGSRLLRSALIIIQMCVTFLKQVNFDRFIIFSFRFFFLIIYCFSTENLKFLPKNNQIIGNKFNKGQIKLTFLCRRKGIRYLCMLLI